MRRVFAALLTGLMAAVMLGIGARGVCADEVIPPDPPLRWWKGNIHTHSFWSDGTDFPEMIAEWYRVRDYNFLALSDHNIVSQGQKWMPYAEIVRRRSAEAIDKYLARYGSHWVETRGNRDDGTFEVRLKPLNEFRALVEQRGQFIMMQGEEISDRFEKLPIHLNATNLVELIKPQGGSSVQEVMRNNVLAVIEQMERTGQEMIVHLNHPNFGWAVTAEDLAHVIEEQFFEVYNGHPGVRHEGDHEHVGIERMWDIANAIRLAKLNAAPLYGIGTDDSHHYHVSGMGRSTPGRGWIMVRARHLTPESIIRAMRDGDFYASSGVTLRDVRFSSDSGVLELEIEPVEGETYTTYFIGTPTDYEFTVQQSVDSEGRVTTGHYGEEIGMIFATETGLRPRYQLKGNELYIRAMVMSSAPPENPSFENQFKQAWTQPVGWKISGEED